MNKKHKILALSMLTAAAQSKAFFGFFQYRSPKIHDHTRTPEDKSLRVELNDDEHNLIISLVNLTDIDSTSISFVENEMTIKTPHGIVNLRLSNQNVLSLVMEDNKQIKKKNDNYSYWSSSSSRSEHHHHLTRPINLETAEPKYNKEKQTLTITIPYQPKEIKPEKIIPIEIEESSLTNVRLDK